MHRRVLTWTCVLVVAGWLLVGWRLGDLRFGMLGITAYASQPVESAESAPADETPLMTCVNASIDR